MPNMQTLVLTDRATTPVNITFSPRGGIGGVGARLVKAGTSAVGDQIFTIDPRVTPGGRFKATLSLSRPVAQEKIENGVSSYVAVRANRASVTFDFAPDSTLQERKDLIGMVASALDASKTIVNDTLTNMETIW